MRLSTWPNLLVVAIVIGVPLLSRAQDVKDATSADKPAGQVLRVQTRLVVLDVVVTGHGGAQLSGLKKDDFHVEENGVEQRVRAFDPPSAHAMPAGLVVHSSSDLARAESAPVNILVLDELNTRFEDTAYSRYSMERFLHAQPESMPPTILLAVHEKTFSVLQDYSTDRAVLLEALHRDPAEDPWRLARQSDTGPDAIVRLAQTLTILNEISQSAAGVRGRKNILWVGAGFPSIDLTGVAEESAKPLKEMLQQTANLLLDSRSALTLIDPRPLSSATYDSEDSPELATLEDQTGMESFGNALRLSTLALSTGGSVYRNRNDLDRELAEAVRNGADYYTLAYSPSQPGTDRGEYRAIRVTVDKPGVTVMTRQGYFAVRTAISPERASLPKSGDAVDIASAVLTGLTYTGLSLRAGGGASGRFSLAVPNKELTWTHQSDGGMEAHIVVVSASFSMKDHVLSHTSEERTLRLTSTANAYEGDQVLTIAAVLPPGAVRVRFVVRDMGTGRMGSNDMRLDPKTAKALLRAP